MSTQTDELPVERVPDPAFICGVDGCTYEGRGKLPRMDVGRHRWQKHGVRTASAKPKAERARRSSKPREPRSIAPRRRSVAASVASSTRKLGILAMPRLPVTGSYCVINAEELGRLLDSISAKNPALRAWLEKADEATDWIGLAWWAGGLAYAVGIDFERVPPTGAMAHEFGLDEITSKVDAELDRIESDRDLHVSRETSEGGERAAAYPNGEHPASVLD